MQEAYVSYKSSPGQHVRKGHALYKYTDPTAITRCLDGATTVNQGYIYIYINIYQIWVMTCYVTPDLST